MATRTLRPRHQDEIRTKIQTSQLVNVLQNHALGTDEKEMTTTRMKAIEILLRKTLPDLSATELTGADGEAIEQSLTVRLVSPNK
jgi:hypothetical protein